MKPSYISRILSHSGYSKNCLIVIYSSHKTIQAFQLGPEGVTAEAKGVEEPWSPDTHVSRALGILSGNKILQMFAAYSLFMLMEPALAFPMNVLPDFLRRFIPWQV